MPKIWMAHIATVCFLHSYANCYVCTLHERESNVNYLVHLLARSFQEQACNCNSGRRRCCKLNAKNLNGMHCNCLLFTLLCELLCVRITWVGIKCKLFSMSAGQIISGTSMLECQKFEWHTLQLSAFYTLMQIVMCAHYMSGNQM